MISKIKTLISFKKYLWLSLVLILSIIIYNQLPNHQFQTSWDDHWVVINFYTEGGITAKNSWRILTEFHKGQYAPVNQMYYCVLYALFGYSPVAFHVGSLIVHLINVCLIFIFLKLLIAQSKMMTKNQGENTAIITCLIFAIHPLMVESVAWISASKILLYAMCYLAGLIFYLKYLNTSKVEYFALTIILFVLSYFGKEQAVTFSLCLILIDFIIYKKKIPKKIWIQKIPFILMSVIFGGIAVLSQSANAQGFLSNNDQYPLYQRIIFCLYSVFEYLSKCLVPVNLSYIYPFPNQLGEALPITLFVYPVILIIILINGWKIFRFRWLFFGISFFIIHLLPVIHIIPISRFVIIADRYVYLSTVGVFFLLAYGINYLTVRYKKYRYMMFFALFVYVLSLSCYSFKRNRVWHDSESLKREIRDGIRDRGVEIYPEVR